MTNKKDLLKFADAMFRCGTLSGASGDEIVAFAKKTWPTKNNSEWIAALMEAAKRERDGYSTSHGKRRRVVA